jgi:hypothetical protein
MLCEMEVPVFEPCYDAFDGNFSGPGPVQTGDTSGFPGSFIPKIWAMESLRILKEKMGVTNLVHRDFQNEVASFGDLVHTRRPGEVKTKRRTDSTPAANLLQNVQATDVQVPLNQWFNESITIPEGAMSKSFVELSQVYLEPLILSIARGVDRAVLGRLGSAFLGAYNMRAGRLNALNGTNVYDACVRADEVLNINKADTDGRSLLCAPSAKATMLGCDKFVEAQKRGDGGKTLQSAVLGSILGFDTYMFQNVPSVLGGTDIELGTVTAAHAAASKDAQALSLTDCVAGEFVVVSGNDQPTWAAAVDGSSKAVTLNEPNAYATTAGTAVARYKACAVAAPVAAGYTGNTSYAAGWAEDVVLGSYGAGAAPQIGQLVAFGSGAGRALYVIIETTTVGNATAVLLDRPLDYAVAVADPAYPGPMGSFNIAMHKNALALVTRPLATTHAAGIEFGVQEDYGMGIRIAMQHKINEGLVIAVDMLAGVAVLDTRLAVPLLG